MDLTLIQQGRVESQSTILLDGEWSIKLIYFIIFQKLALCYTDDIVAKLKHHRNSSFKTKPSFVTVDVQLRCPFKFNAMQAHFYRIEFYRPQQSYYNTNTLLPNRVLSSTIIIFYSNLPLHLVQPPPVPKIHVVYKLQIPYVEH